MKPCTAFAPAADLKGPCEHCQHTNLVHRGKHNPTLESCVLCQLEQLLPQRQGPDEPVTPVGRAPVLLYLAVDVQTGRMRAFLDEVEAIKLARAHNGVVATLAVSSDWREVSDG